MSHDTIIAYTESAAIHLAEAYRRIPYIECLPDRLYLAGKANGETYGILCGMRELHYLLERLYRWIG